jgi:2-dehydro-3-deoxygluconokinase
VKNGPNSALVSAGGRQEFVPVLEVVDPIDTTAAGDSFNAAYLASRIRGAWPPEAAAAGHALAAEVILHRGAVMPKDAMPSAEAVFG